MSDENIEKPLIATRLGSGKTSKLELSTTEGVFLGRGTTGVVSRVSVNRRGPDREGLSFAHKQIKDADHGNGIFDTELVKDSVSRIQEIHRKLLKLPHGHDYTPGTLRYTQEGMLMTDLSEGGKYLVFSWNDVDRENIKHLKAKLKQNPRLLEIVKQIDMNSDVWRQEYDRQAQLIASETGEAGIYIPGDAPMIVLKPDNKFTLVVGDLDSVSVGTRLKGQRLVKNNLDGFEGLKTFMMELVDQVSEPGFLD